MNAFAMVRAAAACAAGLTFADAAQANGRLPASLQLVVSPDDPTFLSLETTFALLLSYDGGRTFNAVCESAVGYGDAGVEDPPIAMTPGALLAGTRHGLSVSLDRGCSWALAESEPVIDLVVRRDDPHTVLLLTSRVTDAGPTFESHVLVGHDDKMAWTEQGTAIDPAVQVETIEVARSDPNRIYIGGAGYRPDLGRIGVFLASRDGGATYSQTTIPFEQVEALGGAAFVSAVDPNNPDRVYVRMHSLVRDRLLVSRDAGTTFQTAYVAKGLLLGFALSDDGSKVFVGGPSDGILMASASSLDSGTGTAFVQQDCASVQCLSYRAGSLYACISDPRDSLRQLLGVSMDDGLTLTPTFQLACVSGPPACPGGALAAQCGSAVAVEGLGTCREPAAEASLDFTCRRADAGTDASLGAPGGKADSSAGTAVGSPSSSGPSGGAGCRISPRVHKHICWALSLLGVVAYFRRLRITRRL